MNHYSKTKRSNGFAAALSILFVLQSAGFAQTKPPPAELVVINAVVRTMDAAKPRAEALAVSGNKIAAVGTTREIRALTGKNTKTIDARGKLLIPGFNDSHVHFLGIGNQFFSIDLRDARGAPEALAEIVRYTRFLPKGEWILGGAWDHENWTPARLPTKELIDAATPDHPVFIYHADPRMALANSVALRLAGIDKNTKAPAGGEIARDAEGAPTGILKGTAINLVKRSAPVFATQNRLAVVETATNYAASLGVTSVQDVHSDDSFEIYRELARRGKLKTRVYDCIALSEWRKLAYLGVRPATGDALVRRGCLKHFSDGDDELIPELFENISAADKAGLQVMMHAIGTRPNDIVLTVFERVLKANGARDRRFRVEHAHNFRARDLPRFVETGTFASMQPHLFFDGSGDDAENFATMKAANVRLAFGSDASITDFNPLYGIYAAVYSENPKNKIFSVEDAVRAYTVGSAYAEFQEREKGTIAPGKLADFVILSDDIFLIDRNRIKEVKVLKTIVDGRLVFESE